MRRGSKSAAGTTSPSFTTARVADDSTSTATPTAAPAIPAGRTSILAANPLSIGDRIGSYYHGFPGFIDQVRISTGAREFRRLRLEQVSERRVFVRYEPDVRIRLTATNLDRAPLVNAGVRASLDGMGEKLFELPAMQPGSVQILEYPLDTSLRPNPYTLRAQWETAGPQPDRSEERLPVRLVPRPLPHQFPVLMWGIYGGVPDAMQQLQSIGLYACARLGRRLRTDLAGVPRARSRRAAAGRTDCCSR